jgi:hypothetical protein
MHDGSCSWEWRFAVAMQLQPDNCISNHCLYAQAMGSRAWLVLSSCMQPVALQPGHDLCKQGTSANGLWFLTEGDDTMVAISPHEKRACMQAAAQIRGTSLLKHNVQGSGSDGCENIDMCGPCMCRQHAGNCTWAQHGPRHGASSPGRIRAAGSACQDSWLQTIDLQARLSAYTLLSCGCMYRNAGKCSIWVAYAAVYCCVHCFDELCNIST